MARNQRGIIDKGRRNQTRRLPDTNDRRHAIRKARTHGKRGAGVSGMGAAISKDPEKNRRQFRGRDARRRAWRPGGECMKKWALIVFVFWNCTFSSDGGKTWDTTRRQRGFDNYMSAQQFIDRAPRGVFECVDSLTGMSGACKVSAFEISGAS